MHPLDNLFRLWLPIGAGAVLATVLVVGIVAEPDRYELGYAPAQPIPFSHPLHAGQNRIPCQYCHSGAARSRHAGVPPLGKCMNCHRVTRTDREPIRRITAAWEAGQAFAWQRVYATPDHVYFDHRPHVHAAIACQECHGRVEEMATVARVLNMRMGKCLECHRGERSYFHGPVPDRKGPDHCSACHR